MPIIEGESIQGAPRRLDVDRAPDNEQGERVYLGVRTGTSTEHGIRVSWRELREQLVALGFIEENE